MNWNALGLLILTLSLSVTACAPDTGFRAHGASNSVGLTGFSNAKGAPYTVGGDTRIIEDNKRQAAAPTQAPISAASKALAESIVSARFVRVDNSDKIDRLGRKEVRGAIELEGLGVYTFQGALKNAGGQRVTTQSIDLNAQLQVEAEFEDEANQRYSTGRVTLRQLDARKQVVAQAEIFLRSYAAAVNASLATDVKLNAVNSQFAKLMIEHMFAWVSNIVIQNGRSFYEVVMYPGVANNQLKGDEIFQAAAGRRLFSFAGEAVRTGDFDPSPARRREAGLLELLSVGLIGDAEEDDQRTFAATIKGHQGQNIDLALKIEKPHADLPNAGPQVLKGYSPSSFLKVKYNDPRYPRVKKNIDDFERTYSLPGVQSWITKFTSPKSAQYNYLRSALTNAGPFRPIIEEIFHSYQVAPSASVVTYIESAFFARGNFVLQTNPESTATGPFQLVTNTGKGMGLLVADNAFGQLPPAWDQRMYFAPSTCGAAKHFSDSMETVARSDSTLAIPAYYLGNYGVTRSVHQAFTGRQMADKKAFDLVQRYNISYTDVARQRMLPSSVLDYTNKALSLYFVTGNPSAHGFSWVENPSLRLPDGKVMPPQKEFGDSVCRRAIYNLRQAKQLE